MKNKQINFILFFLCGSFLLGNSFVFENRFTFKTMINQQDTTQDDQNNTISDSAPYIESFKSPGKALLYSSVLPGMGQFYMENWMRGLLFIAIDGIAIGTWYNNNKQIEERDMEYKLYSNEHWDFGRWIHDYYKWYEHKNGDSTWNNIREAFINRSDSLLACDQDPTQGHCYIDIWDHSHSVKFTYDNSIMSSSSEEFMRVFQDLCGNQYVFDKECSIDEVNLIDSKGDTIYVIPDHHFYEGIQKYDEFFAGWDDNVDVEIIINPNTSIIVTSPNQQKYQDLWKEADRIIKLVSLSGKFMLINRAVSMVDALLLAKKWSNKYDVKLSLNAYPDLRNKSGLGGVKLSIHFK